MKDFSKYDTNKEMIVNGLSCILNTPDALKSRHGTSGEIAHGLPPYAPRPAFAVDDYEACPDNWMRGSKDAASYFVPVEAGKGMWLDFTRNQHQSDHEVAVVVSIQGVNAITGLPVLDPHLEQYREKCPVHRVKFEANRFCPKCTYEWPAQNYLSTTSGRVLWIDGFRLTGANGKPTGETRQFYFTKDVELGVAAQILGDKRVFALGISFFLSKEPKPKPVYRMRGGYDPSFGALYSSKGIGSRRTLSAFSLNSTLESARSSRANLEDSVPLEIGAGAKIDQDLGYDPNPISFWREKPEGILYVNYVDVVTAERILEAGKRDRTAGGEGWMNPLRTGNPGPVGTQ